ncbi:stage II sporulation protein D [Marmoricola sp. OAE513]|uniref:SpoIID/LytB domain-containing protein n=1 Tax=Marmoricola sp. OAE513 TaxID=2817894 RepID=UPI001AE25891
MRTRTALVTTALLGASFLAAPAPASAAEAWVDYDADGITVLTQGFGHGIGMSQYGAKGRADAGQTAAQILDFYYPGTKLGTDARRVKVLLTGDDDGNVIVFPEKGLKVVDLATGKGYKLPTSGQKLWRLRTKAGKTRVAYSKGNGWKLYRIKGRASLKGAGEFRGSTGALTLRTPEADRRYRGGIRLIKGNVVNILTLDSYLRGVVPAEMPALWAPEAVKAQAVAARTYAAFEMSANPKRTFGVYDTTRSQVYKGVSAEQPGSDAAIRATAGKIVTYQGKPAFTQFSASNGGVTAKGGQPYLVGARPDTFDTAYRNRELVIGPNTKAKLEKKYPALGSLQRVRVVERDTDQRVLKVQLDGAKNDSVIIKGTDLRTLIGLRSHYFTFTP